ncbi:MAG: hypothetical protein B7X04_01395 [Parcubacteria group bacterium 21-54-25]|nr:MAG: hypothetical protein B7X04_01395 [Parcubacteria group bacterium 21-54-25]HQU07584.1 zincin-like metallopeptidase domain-containing protein [Candidatus Paceibacterota bacterium]
MDTDRSFKKSDLYARVTDHIIQAIEAGATDYVMPWHEQSGAGLPRNASTGNLYHGVNTVSLWTSASRHGYGVPYWATLRQWGALGARVLRGEKASLVVFYKREEAPADTETSESVGKRRGVLRASFVFNALQVDGWSPPVPEKTDRTERLQAADDLIEALGAEILYGSTRACYSPTLDRIFMPGRPQFIDGSTSTATEGFYSVLLHEHIHWSGYRTRLNRDLTGRFGDSAYAMEELVAELGAAFLCAELGIEDHPRHDHAAYVASWLEVLRRQKSAIFTAASTATAACRYLSEVASRVAQSSL